MPKGHKTRKTVEKERAREIVRALITKQLKPLIDAQIAHALGLKFLVVRDKTTGKFVRVSEAMARQREKLGPNEEVIEVWQKEPSVPAFTDLLNRAIDKPADQQQSVHVTGTLTLEQLVAGSMETPAA